MRKTLSFGLALLGLFDALYLLWSYAMPGRPMVCIGGGCDAVRASAYSSMWGVPMPVFGVAGYAALAILIAGESLSSSRLAWFVRYAVAAATGAGFLFSMYLEYLQAFVIHAYCAWCITSGATMTVLFALSVAGTVRPSPAWEPAMQLAEMRRHFLVFVLALIVGVPAFAALMRRGELPPPQPAATAETLAQRLIRPDSHATGDPSAALTVVEFGDFECAVCGRAAEAVRDARSRYAGRVRFVFRQFPLTKIHPDAQRAAEASECMAEKGKFWDAVEKIYARQLDLSDQGLLRDATELGLDREKYQACVAVGSGRERIRRDVEDGQALGVRATPTFFIGEKRVEGVLPAAELFRLIDAELGVQQPAASKPQQAPAQTMPQAPPAAPAPVTPKGDTPAAAAAPAPARSGSLIGIGASGGFGSSPGAIFGAPAAAAGEACNEADAAKKQATLIETPELRQILAGSAKPLFVDVRPAKEFAGGSIPGATNIPADEISRRWSSLPKDRPIILYESGRSSGDICAAGRSAGRTLLEHGFPTANVKVYRDGLAGWEKAGLSLP
jgi:protein-disulfide isomerase/rhodanese-related sulfurtransferase